MAGVKEYKVMKNSVLPFVLLAMLAMGAYVCIADPTGPTAVFEEQRNMTAASNYTMNTTGGPAGGNIFVYNLSSNQANTRWKGYVGSISGSLRLADSTGILYEWSLGNDFTAEVYATRTDNPITWSNINCTWAKTSDESDTNRSREEEENAALNFNNHPIDNISATFPTRDNVGFQVGGVTVPQDYCYTTNPYMNSTDTEGYFEEALLHDGTYLVYATVMNKSASGYDNGRLYDYEMIIPENADPTFYSNQLSTAYYFYLELA